MSNETKSKSFTFRLTLNLLAALRELANWYERTPSDYICFLIRREYERMKTEKATRK